MSPFRSALRRPAGGRGRSRRYTLSNRLWPPPNACGFRRLVRRTAWWAGLPTEDRQRRPPRLIGPSRTSAPAIGMADASATVRARRAPPGRGSWIGSAPRRRSVSREERPPAATSESPEIRRKTSRSKLCRPRLTACPPPSSRGTPGQNQSSLARNRPPPGERGRAERRGGPFASQVGRVDRQRSRRSGRSALRRAGAFAGESEGRRGLSARDRTKVLKRLAKNGCPSRFKRLDR